MALYGKSVLALLFLLLFKMRETIPLLFLGGARGGKQIFFKNLIVIVTYLEV